MEMNKEMGEFVHKAEMLEMDCIERMEMDLC